LSFTLLTRPAAERRRQLKNSGQRDSIFASVEAMGDIRASIYARIHHPSTERVSIFVASNSHFWRILLEEAQVQSVGVGGGLESELRDPWDHLTPQLRGVRLH